MEEFLEIKGHWQIWCQEAQGILRKLLFVKLRDEVRGMYLLGGYIWVGGLRRE